MSSILIIYTGGTIGMVRDEDTGALKTFNFDALMQELPEIKNSNLILKQYHLRNLSIHQICNLKIGWL